LTVNHTLWFVVYQKRVLAFWFVCITAFPSGIHFSVWQQYIYWRNCLNRTCKCLGMCCQFRKLFVNILFCRYHLTQYERPRIFCLTSKKEITKARESIWTIFGLNVKWSEHGIIDQNIETSNIFYGLIPGMSKNYTCIWKCNFHFILCMARNQRQEFLSLYIQCT